MLKCNDCGNLLAVAIVLEAGGVDTALCLPCGLARALGGRVVREDLAMAQYPRVVPKSKPDRLVAVVGIFGVAYAHAGLGAYPREPNQRQHAEAILNACADDLDRVGTLIETFLADNWVRSKNPTMKHLASTLPRWVAQLNNSSNGRVNREWTCRG